ncbi:TRAP transporter substrate-binding protein DctP [Bosea sp. (in: a-proteobacteria)]|jgi:tripartite ATP-independent transporter DctP family solute receptor|uniref:TRAP transporter substrate-binding protein DctP n=1 Tax=Bosea sp. (in: a-proteobacteria) TaxID=1871050 RepID=UPI003F70C5DB
MMFKTIAASAALTGLLLAGAPAEAQQKPTVLRFGHMNSPTHIVNLGGQRLKAAMEKAQGGPVQIDLFPSAQLGENSAVLEQLTLGSNIITQVGPGTIAQYVPNYSVMVHPFLFKDWAEVKKVADSPLVKGWEKDLVKHNIKPLCFFNFGTRDLYTRNKPVKTPADSAGLKIRVQPVAIYTEMVKSMGGQPTPMPWPEVYSALSQGVIDSAEAPPNAIIDQKHFETAKFYMKTNHILDAAMVVMSLRAFNALNAEQKKTLETEANAACDWMSAESEKVYDSSVAELEKRGMTIVNDVDRDAFAKAADSIQKAFPTWSPNLVADIRKQLGR